MNKDLKHFENRSDDWLAKQREKENTVSAWDIDEGKKIKYNHEENCEAKEIKERHEKIHSGQIKPSQKQTSFPIFLIIIIAVFAIDVIPGIIGNKEIMPFGIIAIIAFMLAISSITKKG